MRKARMIVDPAWLNENIAEIKAEIEREGELENFFPEEYGKGISDEGDWILVIHAPQAVVKIPRFSIWFAMQSEPSMKHRKWPIYRKLASVLTSEGELRLFPREYQILGPDRFRMYLEFTTPQNGNKEPDLKMVLHGSDPRLTKRVNEMRFYLRSRGISAADSLMMLLPEVKDPSYCHFEFHEEYVRYFTRGNN